MSQWQDAFRPIGQSILSGLLLTASFPLVLSSSGALPLELIPREVLVVPAAGYFFRLATRSAPRFRWGFLAAFVHFATLLSWLVVALTEFGRMPWYQTIPVLGLLAGYCALFLAAVPDLTAWFVLRVRVPRPVCFAAAVVLLEWLRSHLLTGFSWGLWGYSQARNLALAQLAAWGGVYLVSAMIAILGALSSCRKSWFAFFLVLVSAHAPGLLSLVSSHDPPSEGIQVAILQGNIRQNLKNGGAATAPQIARVYRELLREAESQPVDLVVWPESSWPFTRSISDRDFSIRTASSMIVGVVQTEAASSSEPQPQGYRVYNSAIYVEPGGQVSGSQHKLHLVPFGEYVPLRSVLPVEKFVPGLKDLTPGDAATPLGPAKTGVQICFDGTFTEIGRAHVRSGAELLANLSNDGWYGISSGPYQHRDFYVFRAIEMDRYLIRATNTGVSAVIGPQGRIRKQSKLGFEDVLRARVYRKRTHTPYFILGDWVPAFSLGLFLASGGAMLRDTGWSRPSA